MPPDRASQSQALAEFAAGLNRAMIPDEVFARAEDLFVDWAASALAAWPLADGTAKTCLLFFAVTSYGTALLNLTPFIKLDGYIALMSHVDVPYLRDRAMADARRALARFLFGGTYQRELPTRWTVVYGFACLAFPVYFLSTALQTWLGTLQRVGWVGLLLAASGLSYIVWMLVRGALRLSAEVKAAGVRRARAGAVCGALAAAVCAALFLPVQQTVAAAYVTDASGTRLVLPQGSSAELIHAGQRVTLKTNGLVLQDDVATARVKINPAQSAFIDRLAILLTAGDDSQRRAQ